MEGPLRRETLGRSLGSHDATELVGGMCHGNGCRQETTRLHAISCTKTGWSSLTHNRLLHQALARSLRESKAQFVVEDTWPFRQRAGEENGRLNPLDIATEAGALFDNHPRLKNKALLLDITIVNPCAGSNLGNAARHVGKHLADAVERKKNKYRGSFLATYSLLPLAMSTCGDVGSDVHALINELAIRRVQHRSETSHKSQHLMEGTEVARLRRRFSFVLQQALSFRTRHHFCRQGVALASPTAPFTRSGVCTSASYRGGNRVRGTGRGERGRERDWSRGGNGDGNGDVNGHGDGDGAGTGTGVEVNEGAQDGDGSGDGAGTGTGTGTRVGTRRRTPDGNGDGNGDGSEESSEGGNGDDDNRNGNENRIGEGG